MGRLAVPGGVVMVRAAVAVTLFATLTFSGGLHPRLACADEPQKPRDATKPERIQFGYGGPPVKGVTAPDPIAELPLRLPEKIVGELRFHVPTGATASIPSPDGKLVVSAGGNMWGYPLWLF